MPDSRGRKPRRHVASYREPADLEAAERARKARREDLQRYIGWSLVVIGVGLFLMGQIGARTGWVALPFDRHHFISQVAGFFLAIRGLMWAWK